MLTEMTIENLKCFGEKTTIPLAPMTLIYGENSSGKSSVLLALQMLKHSVLNPQRGSRKEIPFKNYVTGHDTSKGITLGVTSQRIFEKEKYYGEDPNCYFSLTSTLAWSEDLKRAEVITLSVKAPFCPPKCEQRTWDFQREDGDLEAAINIYSWLGNGEDDEGGKLYQLLKENCPAILKGVDRQIEKEIMQDYLDQNPEECKRFLDNKDESLRARGKFRSVSVFPSKEQIETDEEYAKRKITDNAERAKAYATADEWRLGLLDWISDCPPNWKAYRESADFQEKALRLRNEEYSDIIAFCDKPNEAYFAEHPAKLQLYNGDIMQPQYNQSPVFTRDSWGIDDLILSAGLNHESGKVEASVAGRATSDASREIARLSKVTRDYVLSPFRSVGGHINESLQRIKVIAPLRERAQRIYSSVSMTPGDLQSDLDGASVPLLLRNDPNLCARVNTWLEKLGVDYEVVINPVNDEYFELLLRDTRNSDPDAKLVQYADVGFGISQVLPILAACLSDEPSTILIEQPELHIHPRLQAELGSLFAEAINTYHHQLIVETHSEHLMLRVQKLVRTKEMRSHQVNVHYVCRGETGSHVQLLRLAESGRFKDLWPGGFFPERENEMEGE